ncbi:hypothetical protein FHR29_000301 [Sphingobacterium sp. JUb56]|nr:hypothetical protein [Sphingobacterium sp. JUb56]
MKNPIKFGLYMTALFCLWTIVQFYGQKKFQELASMKFFTPANS